jgi:lipid II:glycine glycyltransferase (peptidoglycan interpeptide bridge formation enzyme)
VSTQPDAGILRNWDRLVERTPGTDVTQLSAWARVRSTRGFEPVYLFAHRAGELVGGAQILSRRIPVMGGVGYLPYGPLIDPTVDDRAMVRRGLVQGLRRLSRRRLRMLFVQPPEGAEDVSADLLVQGFRPSSADIAPAGSIRIDLNEDLHLIRSRFGKRLRSWPNRWDARGVTVELGGEQDVPLLATLMKHTAERQGFSLPPADYIATMYRQLAAGNNAALFVGRVHGVPVAADLVTVCGGMIRGRLTGFDRCGEAARLSVPAAIRWEIIKWGKSRGLRWLDFGGLSAATLDALIGGGEATQVASTDQPKLTFGGRPFRYPQAVEMVGPAPLRMAYDLALHSPRGRQVIKTAQRVLRGSARRNRDDRGDVGAAQPESAPVSRGEPVMTASVNG